MRHGSKNKHDAKRGMREKKKRSSSNEYESNNFELYSIKNT